MIGSTLLAVGLGLLQAPPAAASRPAARPLAAPPHKQVFATRVSSGAVQVDGRLDDAVWASARWITDFTQKMPVEGAPPSDSMRIAILYDDHAVYVGARMRSRDPAHIQSPLSRRDNTSQAEHLWVSFDTYHDRRTAYSFGVTASGVRMDWYHPQDSETSNLDGGFDPVWEARAIIDSLGWTTELRIPFSQLRFNDQPEQVWGFNADHWIPAHNEDVFWIPVPTNQTGWSSWMGELIGISGIKPSRRLELMPYVAGNSTITGARDPGNPFDDGRNLKARAGADLKMGLGPNMTLDATVNPDFGQVEADPAVVNLTAFEVFFDERRPFFTEGSQLLRGNGPSYFYSRRIGGPPRGAADGNFVDYPGNTTILGAAKVTGRLASGISLGALGAVTGRETARTVVFDTAGVPHYGRPAVAPMAGYGVARLQQEFGAGASVIGLTLTGVTRHLSDGDSLADLYTRRAIAGGADWVHRWDRGAYELRGWLGFSHIVGSAPAIDRVQRSAVHFFQRPDADYFQYDSLRTALTGTIANLQLTKNGGGHWLYGFGAGWETPAYDPNDVGRLSSSDGQFGFVNLRYRETKPTRTFQNYEVGLFSDAEWDFGGERQFLFAELSGNLTLRNFWTVNSYFDFIPRNFDHGATRGGPTMATPQSWNFVTNVGNSFGAKTKWNARVYYGQDELGGETYRLSGGLSLRPGPRWQLSVTPNYLREITARQFVDSAPGGPAATYGTRYLFAFIDQSTFLMQLRLNYTLRPDLTLDLYAEPFAASGRYYGLGELAAARGFGLRQYGTDGTTIARDSVGDYTITDGAATILVANPDFNVLSFRSNAVVRWEWRPGSTLFLVWQQNRFGFDTRGVHVGPGDLWDSFRATGDNFLAIKASYWFSLQ